MRGTWERDGNNVTVRSHGAKRLTTTPTYEKTEHFFFRGLVGEGHVDVASVCGQGSMIQMRTQNTFADGLLQLLTIGIYAPSHIRVWCE